MCALIQACKCARFKSGQALCMPIAVQVYMRDGHLSVVMVTEGRVKRPGCTHREPSSTVAFA